MGVFLISQPYKVSNLMEEFSNITRSGSHRTHIHTITYANSASLKGDDDEAGIQDLHSTQSFFSDGVPLQ